MVAAAYESVRALSCEHDDMMLMCTHDAQMHSISFHTNDAHDKRDDPRRNLVQ